MAEAATLTSGTAIRSAGEYTDAETGFVYLRARYYDLATGQFISRDPLTAMTGQPYSYVDNNPLNGTDPLGLLCLSRKCLVHDLVVTSAVVQVTADAVTIVAAAIPGGQGVAAVALGVSEVAGVVNAAATCASAAVGAGATGVDCLANGAIEGASLGLGNFLGGPSEWSKGKAVYTAADRIISAGVDLFGAGLSWARGYKVPDPSRNGAYCPITPRLQGPRR